MARKNYSEEFRRQAVDLYESTPGAQVRGIADDLGIVRGTLAGHVVETHGTGKKTAADGTLTHSPLRTTVPATSAVNPGGVLELRVARLEAENAQLRAETTKLATAQGNSSRGRRSISLGRRAGVSLPVRRRELHHLPGEATV